MNQLCLKNLIKSYIKSLSLERDYSASTCRAYTHDLKEFLSFLNQKNFKLPAKKSVLASDVTPQIIRSYLGALHKKNKRSTITRKISVIRSFFIYLVQKGLIKTNPAEYVLTPKQEKTIPAYLSVDDMFRVLDSIETTTVLDLRNLAMFELMYSTGIRVSELVAMNVFDVDLDEQMIRVKGKGEKDRVLPAGNKAMKALSAYREKLNTEKGIPFNENGPLFLNKNKGRISARSVGRILEKILSQCGLFIKISPHGLRHTFASHMLDAGADLRTLQEFLGHKNLSTTQKYTHVSIDKLMETYDKSHPRH